MSSAYAPTDWHAWFPPALDDATSQAIADAWWDSDPHEAAALAWEAYAATLPPTAPVSAVATGAQQVSYSPAQPVGAYGAALARAAWHRSVGGNAYSVALTRGRVDQQIVGWPRGGEPTPMGIGWWEPNSEPDEYVLGVRGITG